jgi:hypothetical protein
MPFPARLLILPAIAAVVAVVATIASGGPTADTQVTPGAGTLAVQLSDAAFLVEDVRRADVFVVRIDARLAGADSASAARGMPDDSAGDGGWTTILTPNTLVNLLDYQYRVALPLGEARLAAGTYKGFRLVIDPSRSSLTLLDGKVLIDTSTVSVEFGDLTRTGIKIFLPRPMTVHAGETTTVRVDFALDERLAPRGPAVANTRLVFRPVLQGTVQPRSN